MSDSEALPIIPISKARKAKASVWRDIGVAETDHVLKLQNVDESKAFLIETFGIERDPDENYLIVLDMFYNVVQFSRDNNFTSEKTSSLLSIAKQTHEMATETPFENITETLWFFKDLILCHSVHHPPFSLEIFSPLEASVISDYMIDSYFCNFKLYKYIFTPKVLFDLRASFAKFPTSTRLPGVDNNYSTKEDTLKKNKTDVADQLESEMHKNKPQLQSSMEGNRMHQVEDFDKFDSHSESVGQLKHLIRERILAELQELQSDEAIGKLDVNMAGVDRKQQSAAAANVAGSLLAAGMGRSNMSEISMSSKEESLGLSRITKNASGGYGSLDRQHESESGSLLPQAEHSKRPYLLSIFDRIGQRFFPLGYWKEFVEIGKLHLPSFVTCFLQVLLQTISVIMCGHLSKEQLDAAVLACTFINVAGLLIGLGLSTACDTYFSQTYGSRYKKRVGLYLQRSLIVMYMFLVPVYCLHLNIKPVLLWLGQDPVVSDMTSWYILIFMPGLFFDYTFLVLARYLQTQNRVTPPLICALIGNVFNGISQYVAIYVLGYQYEASAVCQAASLFVMCAVLLIYIRVSGVYEETWDGWTVEALYDIGVFMKLAVPGLAMVVLEELCFEIGTFIAGSISTLQLAAQGIVFQCASLSYMVSLGMSISVNIRVGQHLGASQIERVKHTYRVAVTMILTTSTIICIVFSTCQYYLASIFTNDPNVRKATSELMSFYAPLVYVEGLSATASGVLKGSGRQLIGALVNIAAYYGICIPIGVPLSLLTWMEIRGFWIGLLVALSLETVVFWMFVWRTNWDKQVSDALARVTGTDGSATTAMMEDSAFTIADGNSTRKNCGVEDERTALEPAAAEVESHDVRRRSWIYSKLHDSDVEFDFWRPAAELPPLRPVLIRRVITWLCLLLVLAAAATLRAFQNVYLPVFRRDMCLLRPLNASNGVNLTYCGGRLQPQLNRTMRLQL